MAERRFSSTVFAPGCHSQPAHPENCRASVSTFSPARCRFTTGKAACIAAVLSNYQQLGAKLRSKEPQLGAETWLLARGAIARARLQKLTSLIGKDRLKRPSAIASLALSRLSSATGGSWRQGQLQAMGAGRAVEAPADAARLHNNMFSGVAIVSARQCHVLD